MQLIAIRTFVPNPPEEAANLIVEIFFSVSSSPSFEFDTYPARPVTGLSATPESSSRCVFSASQRHRLLGRQQKKGEDGIAQFVHVQYVHRDVRQSNRKGIVEGESMHRR